MIVGTPEWLGFYWLPPPTPWEIRKSSSHASWTRFVFCIYVPVTDTPGNWAGPVGHSGLSLRLPATRGHTAQPHPVPDDCLSSLPLPLLRFLPSPSTRRIQATFKIQVATELSPPSLDLSYQNEGKHDPLRMAHSPCCTQTVLLVGDREIGCNSEGIKERGCEVQHREYSPSCGSKYAECQVGAS